MKNFNFLAVAMVLTINFQGIIGQINYNQQPLRVYQQCDEGYFWSGQACLQCQYVANGICSCSSYNGCTQATCNEGYYNFGNQTNPNCLRILSDEQYDECMTPSYSKGSVVCAQCTQGITLLAQICVNFQGCKVFSNVTGQCFACQSGYYMINTYYNQYQCDECMTGCSSCGSQYTCQQCLSNYTWNIQTQQCQPKCNISNCQTCSGAYSTCSICDTDYYINTNQTCDFCSITGCSDCQNSTVCASCQSGYYLNNNGTCSQCGSGCQTCTNNTRCLTCGQNYVSSNGTCLACPQNCQSGYCSLYNETAICTQCQDKYTRTNNTTCQSCQVNNSMWIRCEGPMDSSNYNVTQPTQCLNNMFASNVNGINQCIQNSSNCFSYGDTSQTCLTCYPGYYLVGTKCYSCSGQFVGCMSCQVTTTNVTQLFSCSQCSQGYYLNSGICSNCPNSCQLCTSGNYCSICMSGYYLNSNNSTCSLCSVTGCSQCSSSGSCSVCMSGRFLYNNNCQYCPQNCATCTQSGQLCQSCNNGYILQNGGCVQNIQGQGCLIQGQNTLTCQVCEYGYYLLNGQCAQCIVNGFVCRNNEGVSTLTSSQTVDPSETPTNSTSSYAQNLVPLAAIILLLIL